MLLAVLRKAADIHYGLRIAGISFRRRDWSHAVPKLRAMLDRPGAGNRSQDGFYVRMRRIRRSSWVVSATRRLLGSVAEPDKIIWVDPTEVTCAVAYDFNLYAGEVLPGDWDRRTIELDRLPLYRSVVQRYRDGRPWEETDAFHEAARLFERGAVAKRQGGSRTAAALLRYYETQVDGIYDDLRVNGFRVRDIPHVHIGRDGRILFGEQGVQRLAMAKVSGTRRVPCFVHVRHLTWQRTRERFARSAAGAGVGEALAGHPDLADVGGPDPAPPAADETDLYRMANRLPSMGGARIGPLLRRLAHGAPAGTSIVEVGSWLGAGTAQLALGVRERRCTDDVTIHCYDRWRADRTERTKAATFGVRLVPREDTLPRVRRALEPFGVPLRFHQGDIRLARWDGGPISVFVDDTSKTPDLFAQSLRTFGPSWIPGETTIVLMDYAFWQKSGKLEHRVQVEFIESNRRCFERLDWPFASTAGVFLYKAPVDFGAIESAAAHVRVS